MMTITPAEFDAKLPSAASAKPATPSQFASNAAASQVCFFQSTLL